MDDFCSHKKTYDIFAPLLDSKGVWCNDCKTLLSEVKLSEMNKPRLSFGKYKGERVEDVFLKDEIYLKWLSLKPWCPQNIRQAVVSLTSL